uniref:KIB1-4 beta-propeller domain-containing protein n=1 Tax=Aegilops tauschii TaxID=37682 RepID=N1R3R7_AEGTA
MAAAERWSMLPDDLLRLVQGRLPGTVDCARFAAVCTSWRAIGSTLPPRLPWLILDPSGHDEAKHVYCLEDGNILPPLPSRTEAVDRHIIGSHGGGWIVPSDAPLTIMNLFSRPGVTLCAHQRKIRIVSQFTGTGVTPSTVQRSAPDAHDGTDDELIPVKMIFSEPPTFSSCIPPPSPTSMMSRFVGLASRSMDGRGEDSTGTSKQLVKCEVSLTAYGVAGFGAVHWLAKHNQPLTTETDAMYILELRGKVVMVVRTTSMGSEQPWPCEPFFSVLVLVDADTDGVGTRHSYKWEEVRSLGNHALFLGPTCAKAMHVPMSKRDCPRRNHIYYIHNRYYTQRSLVPKDAKEFFTSSNKYGYGRRVYYKKEKRNDNGVVPTNMVTVVVCITRKRKGMTMA